uniref:Uncharacterized protein n=1 Tax=Zea mays TaxID=4577 RepID=A0A804RHP1_MAIZE
MHDQQLAGLSLQPERTGALEHGHELAGEVERHDPVSSADKLAADEDGGDGGAPPSQHLEQRALHVLAPGVAVQLVHQRVHAQVRHQPRHRVAHAAAAQSEHHHRALRRDLHHALH